MESSFMFGGLFFLFWALFVLAALVFWVWMLIDCATNEPSEGNDKIVWIVIIIFTSWIGGLVYYLVRRPERIRIYGK